MEQSMENLTIENMRPDIQGAQNKPAEIKAKLVYRDEDELDTGMQKVQPLPFLDEEIQKHKKVIDDSIGAATHMRDDVPQQVSNQVDQVISMATQGQTTLFKASEVLEMTMSAYHYARFAAQDGFDLKRQTSRLLSEFDETLKAMIECRLESRLDEASNKEEECTRKLVEAVTVAESDLAAQQKRAKIEEDKMAKDKLIEDHSTVRETIKDESSELEMIKQQCSKDLQSIDEEVDLFHEKMGDATNSHMQHEDERKAELEKNRQDQRRLEEELRRLRESERKLVKEIEEGEKLQKKSEEVWVEATDEVNNWKVKIEELQRRTEVSLEVMAEMTKCTDLIMEDAKKKKDEWTQRLHIYEIESLLSLRDALLARGTMLTMSSADTKDIIRDIKTTLDKDMRDKKEASRKGFKMRVDEITTKMKRYTDELEGTEQRLGEMSQSLEEVKGRLNEVDDRLRQLRPGIRLDNLEARYTHCKKLIEKAWNLSSVDGIEFKSTGSYQ